jgi:hypothetical protein
VNLHDKIEAPFRWLHFKHFISDLCPSILLKVFVLQVRGIASLLMLCSKRARRRRLSILSNAASCSLSGL